MTEIHPPNPDQQPEEQPPTPPDARPPEAAGPDRTSPYDWFDPDKDSLAAIDETSSGRALRRVTGGGPLPPTAQAAADTERREAIAGLEERADQVLADAASGAQQVFGDTAAPAIFRETHADVLPHRQPHDFLPGLSEVVTPTERTDALNAIAAGERAASVAPAMPERARGTARVIQAGAAALRGEGLPPQAPTSNEIALGLLGESGREIPPDIFDYLRVRQAARQCLVFMGLLRDMPVDNPERDGLMSRLRFARNDLMNVVTQITANPHAHTKVYEDSSQDHLAMPTNEGAGSAADHSTDTVNRILRGLHDL